MKQLGTDLKGQRFGRLLVASRAGDRRSAGGMKRRAYWLCRCDCGAEKEIIAQSLKNGDAVSCGCFSKERAAQLNPPKHGNATRKNGITPEYRAWCHMRDRCEDSKDKSWENYGGRGIGVCEDWKKSFAPFLAHIGNRPSSLHSIDRIDNDGNYEPGNVRWATKKEQRNNRRDSQKRGA